MKWQCLGVMFSGLFTITATVAEEVVTEVDLFADVPIIKTGTRLLQPICAFAVRSRLMLRKR